ncbi:L-glutamate gamma-semialdehyde dehydrogenase [Caldimonas thermodepolymerans]|jgi:delta-1-pyrroline-5-carboxylate dehydrogenase (PutA C-terminal domain)|uniref:L-glutamate gamma-semialdehyde dehydrogenase n=1 Tax=Caldimonas thermodepolymerans TaxID=215580 RepID=UPI0024912DA6|nr:L-glutamate gamma-semialdehyde dehydrogenase [Caldimonas thermodepolymerans]
MAADTPFPTPPERMRLPRPDRPEADVVQALLRQPALRWDAVRQAATPWVQAVREHPAPFWAMESLLKEYPLSRPEGLALMRLAEALLRVPDVETAMALAADQLGRARFDAGGGSAHPLLAGLSARVLELGRRLLPAEGSAPGLLQRLGAQTVVAAAVRALQLLGRQFVLGRHIDEALHEAQAQRAGQPALRFSFDMLGEGARTGRDAERYLAAYHHAIERIAREQPADAAPEQADGISIKLSALHPRYEPAQRQRLFAELLPRLWTLVERAARANMNLTIDAEESERLELSLDLFEALAARVAQAWPQWQGLGLAVQAYQTRSLEVVQEVARLAAAYRLRLMVRLVKGAYWDGEIKRAQELGLAGYPVYTRKQHTDLAYLACARVLLDHAPQVFPQFATHNAGTIAAVLQMARERGAAFEMQRLHGMGEGIYREVLKREPVALRVYAPVGEHRDLLAYLVRRLLENGANSSFVHQLADARVPLDALLVSPFNLQGDPGLPLPAALYGPARPNSAGVDLACLADREPLYATARDTAVPTVPEADAAAVDAAMQRLHAGFALWDATPVAGRAAALRRAAEALEARRAEFCGLLVREARKVMADAVAEVREAVDFLRYYAAEAEQRFAPLALPGPTGESNELRLRGRGVFVCISPWNFPLAIFTGQVAAALVAGNSVAAKPAEQTPAVAQRMVALLHGCGVPEDALQLLHGPGETVGAALVRDARCAGVAFTGSTEVAKAIQRSLADKDGPIVPLIAETGGINAMLVDSTALPEQVVDAVIQSAFRSAGQRCSALRLLCLHVHIADAVLQMLAGAMQELVVGDPLQRSTDVGPVIDAQAHAALARHVARLDAQARLVARTPLPAGLAGDHLAPVAYEVRDIAEVREEVFGPVLHVVRWGSGELATPEAVIDRVNALGYGLTLGVQTRIEGRALQVAQRARVGNVYVNRNMIGAVVGVQPFGGEGLSGTGPKAGGPHYLLRFASEQTLTINTAAAGGNAALLAGGR